MVQYRIGVHYKGNFLLKNKRNTIRKWKKLWRLWKDGRKAKHGKETARSDFLLDYIYSRCVQFDDSKGESKWVLKNGVM